MHGPGTGWKGISEHSPMKRSRSLTPSQKPLHPHEFNTIVHVETKNEFGTRIAKMVSEFNRDGESIAQHEYRNWPKFASHLDWNSKDNEVRDAKNMRIKLETSVDQRDMTGNYNDKLPPGLGIPIIKTRDLSSFRNGWQPPEDKMVYCGPNGPSRTGHQEGYTGKPSPPKERPLFRTIFAPVKKAETIGKLSKGSDRGQLFSTLSCSEAGPDHSERVRKQRMLKNTFPEYEYSIELGSLKKLPKPPQMMLNFQTMRPVMKMNRFDGTKCERWEN